MRAAAPWAHAFLPAPGPCRAKLGGWTRRAGEPGGKTGVAAPPAQNRWLLGTGCLGQKRGSDLKAGVWRLGTQTAWSQASLLKSRVLALGAGQVR